MMHVLTNTKGIRDDRDRASIKLDKRLEEMDRMFVHIHNLKKTPTKYVNHTALQSFMKEHFEEVYKRKHTRHHSLGMMEVDCWGKY